MIDRNNKITEKVIERGKKIFNIVSLVLFTLLLLADIALAGNIVVKNGQLNVSDNVIATSSGSLGIGTTAPGHKLVVIGNVNISGTLNASTINTTTLGAGVLKGPVDCGYLTGGSDADYCTDATGGGSDRNETSFYNESTKSQIVVRNYFLSYLLNFSSSIMTLLRLNVTSINVTDINAANVTSININATGNVAANRHIGRIDCGYIDGGSDSDYCTDVGADGAPNAISTNDTAQNKTGNLTLNNLFVGLKIILSGIPYIWPAADGSNGQLLSTNATGGLSWISIGTTAVTLAGNFTGTNASGKLTSNSVSSDNIVDGSIKNADLTETGTFLNTSAGSQTKSGSLLIGTDVNVTGRVNASLVVATNVTSTTLNGTTIGAGTFYGGLACGYVTGATSDLCTLVDNNASFKIVWNASDTSITQNDTRLSVGIGTLVPTHKLTVTANDSNASEVRNILALDHFNANLTNGTAGIGTGILFRTVDSIGDIENISSIQGILTNAANTSEASAFTISTRTAGSGLNERVRIDGSGNVGINTTTPRSTLEVNGKVNISGYITVGENVVLTNNSAFGGNVTGTNNSLKLTANSVSNDNVVFNYALGQTKGGIASDSALFDGLGQAFFVHTNVTPQNVSGNITMDYPSGLFAYHTTFGGISYLWPSTQGTSGQILSTNGSGGLSWVADATGADGAPNAISTNDTAQNKTGNLTLNNLFVGLKIILSGIPYIFPSADGTVGQVWSTNGTGGISFISLGTTLVTLGGNFTGTNASGKLAAASVSEQNIVDAGTFIRTNTTNQTKSGALFVDALIAAKKVNATGVEAINFTGTQVNATNIGATTFYGAHDCGYITGSNANLCTLGATAVALAGNLTGTNASGKLAAASVSEQNIVDAGTFIRTNTTNQTKTGALFVDALIAAKLVNATGLAAINVTTTSSNITTAGVGILKGPVDCGYITGGSDADYCADATGAGAGNTGGWYNNTGTNVSKTDYALNISAPVNISGETRLHTLLSVLPYLGWVNILANVSATNLNVSGLMNASSINGTTVAATVFKGGIDCGYIQGGSDGDYCTDATGAGGGGGGTSFSNFTYLDGYFNTSNAVNYKIIANLTVPLPSTGSTVIECLLQQSAGAATTGVQYAVNISGSSLTIFDMRYMSSATAVALCGGKVANFTCAPLVSGGTTITPTEIWAYTKRNVAGNLTIAVKSEVAASVVNVSTGSYCRSFNVNP